MSRLSLNEIGEFENSAEKDTHQICHCFDNMDTKSELDYESEDISDKYNHHTCRCFDVLKVNQNLKPQEPSTQLRSQSTNCISADVLEEGEIEDNSLEGTLVKPKCRYFERGRCLKGASCRFLHLTDKGAYNMFSEDNAKSMPFFQNSDPMLNISWNAQPAYFPYFNMLETPWDLAIRNTKEIIKMSEERRNDVDYDEKNLYGSLYQDLRCYLDEKSKRDFRKTNKNTASESERLSSVSSPKCSKYQTVSNNKLRSSNTNDFHAKQSFKSSKLKRSSTSRYQRSPSRSKYLNSYQTVTNFIQPRKRSRRRSISPSPSRNRYTSAPKVAQSDHSFSRISKKSSEKSYFKHSPTFEISDSCKNLLNVKDSKGYNKPKESTSPSCSSSCSCSDSSSVWYTSSTSCSFCSDESNVEAESPLPSQHPTPSSEKSSPVADDIHSRRKSTSSRENNHITAFKRNYRLKSKFRSPDMQEKSSKAASRNTKIKPGNEKKVVRANKRVELKNSDKSVQSFQNSLSSSSLKCNSSQSKMFKKQ